MKRNRIIALLLALVLVLAACSTGTDDTTGETTGETTETTGETTESTGETTGETEGSTEPATIVFWHAMNRAQEEALTKITEDFMAANENITVELQNQTGYTELQQKITATQVSPDDLPTLTQAYPDWMYNPIQDGLVHELTSYTESLEDYDDILEGFRNGTVINDKVYSMPFNKSTEVLFYNEDALNELGLTVPTTPEELVEVSKAYTEATGNAAVGFDSLSNYYTTYLANNDVVYDSTFDATGEVSQEAVNYHLDGVKEGYMKIAGTDEYFSDLMGSEQVLMYIGSNAGQSYVLSAADGNFTPKATRSPFPTPIQQGTDLFVFESATDAEKEATYKYLTFLTNTENQIYWGIQTGYIPVRTSALESDEYVNSGTMIAPIIEDATTQMFSNPVVQGASEAYRQAGTMMEEVLATPDSADVTATLDNFNQTLQGFWGN